MNFKIGDRVRISIEKSMFDGNAATIWDINAKPNWDQESFETGVKPDDVAYRLDLDGVGRSLAGGTIIAAPGRFLRPLTDPKCTEFIESLKLLAEAEEKV